MNKTHDERHEALLQALLTRDRSRTDPEIARTLRECAQCREQLAGLESVVDSVSALAAERDAVLATPRSPTQAAIEPRVRATLERLRDESAARPAPTPVRPTQRWLWPAVAAAILVAAFFIARETRPKPRPIDQTLGTVPELVSPGEVFGQSDVFECRFDGPSSYGFEFHVEDLSGNTILAPRSLEPRWNPSVEDRSKIPDHFQWWVRAYDATGSLPDVDSGRRSSSRSH